MNRGKKGVFLPAACPIWRAVGYLVFELGRFVPVALAIEREVDHPPDEVFRFRFERSPLFPFFLRIILCVPSSD